ncbi:MAG TPA: hypothetical protein VHX43_12840 [Xanthobacteraceae bacterium]|jgi:hypothetical protein|nr:hypothetical protein [Xanthobacteraceae bacterium]
MARCHRPLVLIAVSVMLTAMLAASQTGLAQTPAAQMPAQQTPAPQSPAPQSPAPQTPQAVPAPAPPAPPPATQSLTAAEQQKINGWIADKGRDIAVTPIITDILGLTNGNQTLTCRAFAAEGDGGEIHQVYVLPDGKGYLEAHFYKDRLDVYWTDKNFALLAAVEGVRGEKPAAASFADAQYGFGFESAWWAKYADAN